MPTPLPDDPLLHQCIVAYAMWFHRPLRADEWLLYAQESPSMSAARGLTNGLFFQQDGTLVASVVQEGLFRVRSR